MSQDPQAMYIEALEAIDNDNPSKARDLLSRVVELDEENVDAWIALSKVVDNEGERRICLTTVLQLDPNNAYAKKELAKSEAKVELAKSEEEIRPGITRRMVRVAAIGSAVYLLVVCGITLLITTAVNSDKAGQRAQFTREARNITATVETFNAEQTSVAETAIMQAITETAQAQALITPSATFTRTPDPAFATWTPTPTESITVYRVAELPPETVPGTIIGWGGRDATSSGYIDVIQILANGTGEITEVINELGRYPTIDGLASRVVFERYSRRIGEASIMTLFTNDPVNTLQGLNEFWQSFNIVETSHPSLSSDGTKVVFDALSRDNNTREVYLIDFQTNVMSQITNDGSNYSYPEISPDGGRILASRQDPANGTDLVLIEVASQNQILMTNDGDGLIESQPSWHPDGQQAIYKAHPAGSANNSEIYLLRVLQDSGSSVLLIATTDADETNAVFGPAGQYIAFASNRGADVYNIYIFDTQTLSTYQLTAEEFDYFPGGWSR